MLPSEENFHPVTTEKVTVRPVVDGQGNLWQPNRRRTFSCSGTVSPTSGGCSCGNAAAQVAIFQCRHQRAIHALLRQQWLSSLARRGLSRHPERLTLKFERDQRRLLHAFSRALRAGPPPCPHCGRTITAEDLDRQEEVRRKESGDRSQESGRREALG